MSSEKKEKKQHKMNFNIKEKLKKTFSKEHLKEVFTGEEQKKHLKQGSYSSIMTVIVLAVIVVINLIVAQIPTSKTQIDLSTQKMYSITDETKTALKDLDQDVTLYYIVQKGSEDDTIEKLLEHYDELSDHIKVETKDPDLYPKFTSQYTDQTVAANSVIVVCGDKSKVVSNSDMWETSTNYQTYQTQTTGFDGEGQITSAITYVTSENNPKVYWVTGHGEASESDLSTNFSDAINKNNVEISDLALMTDDIPEDAEELVIMSPTTDFSEDEANKVITYLENGGKLLMFTSYTGTDMPNLDSILENYGVKRSSGIVVETDSQHYYPQMPYYLLPNIQSDDITTEVKSNYVLMPVAQAIQKLDSYRDTITIKSLLTTTEDAYIENDPENSTWSKSADSETGAFDLGVSITETVDDKETQIIYFSSASMLSSQIDQAISGANSKLAATALTSMCDVEQTVVIPSKSTSYTNLVFTQGAVNTWSIITIAGIPLVLVVIGVMIWMKRRKQ